MVRKGKIGIMPRKSTRLKPLKNMKFLDEIRLPSQSLPRQRACMITALECRDAIDQNRIDTSGELVGIFIGGALGNGLGIKHGYICAESFFQHAPVLEAQRLCRRAGHFIDRVM